MGDAKHRTAGPLTRREFGVLIGSASAMALVGVPGVRAQDVPTLIVASQGGDQLMLYRENVDGTYREQTGGTVEYLIGAHPDRFVKLRAEVPNASFHVYISKADFVTRAISLDLLEPLSADLIPSYATVADVFKTGHSVGYAYTAEGILYNPKEVQKPTSWGALWDPKNKGRVALNRFVDRMIMVASSYATDGARLDDEEAAWPLIEKLVVDQKGKLASSSEQLGQMFEQGEVVVGSYWQARAGQWKKAGMPMDFVAPEEGAIAESWQMGIPRGTSEELRKLAGQWINLAIGPGYAHAAADFWFYPSPNTAIDYPPEVQQYLLSEEEFKKLKSPDYEWIDRNKAEWQERYDRLLTR